MYKNDLIFMINTTTSSVDSNGTIPLTTIARRRGCSLQSSNNGVVLEKAGYYKVSGTITFTAPATGNVIIDLAKNGIKIPGIQSVATVATATTQYITLPIDGIVRVFCNEGQPLLTIINSGIAISTLNVNLSVEYLG